MLFLLWLLQLVVGFGFDSFYEGFSADTTHIQRIEPRAGSKGLSDFEPIYNLIEQSAKQYYSFSVNTSTGVGEYYEYLVFVTGNICTQPDDLAASANESLTVYYSFNALMFLNLELGTMVHFENGYFQGLAEMPVTEADNELYIAVQAPQSTNTTATWTYEIGVSQNDLVFQWDNRPFVEVVDTDHRAALIVTGNLTVDSGEAESFNKLDTIYQLYVYTEEYKHYFALLNNSWCAVRSGPTLLNTSSITTSFTERGGSMRQQFYVEGLNASTTYVAYLVSDFSGSSFGGAVYKQFQFDTLDSEACSLLYDLDFCSQVAYSVPALSLEEYNDTDALKLLYDNRASDLFSNFSKGLQQIACDADGDSIFSPIRSCSDCYTSYKDWLCSVTIPRCTTRNVTGYLHRDANASRNSFIDESVVPALDYFEVLPCVNVCQAIVRDCPADFGFLCPNDNDSIMLSYYWGSSDLKYASCNFVGITASEESAGFALGVAWWVLMLGVSLSIMLV